MINALPIIGNFVGVHFFLLQMFSRVKDLFRQDRCLSWNIESTYIFLSVSESPEFNANGVTFVIGFRNRFDVDRGPSPYREIHLN